MGNFDFVMTLILLNIQTIKTKISGEKILPEIFRHKNERVFCYYIVAVVASYEYQVRLI
jgi:hypothetical protein